MPRPTQQNVAQTLNAYQNYVLSKVSKVRILGERHERELKDVFVDLSIVEQGEPDQHAEFLGFMDTTTRRRMNPFQAQTQDVPSGDSERRGRDAKRRLRPEELLRFGTKAIVRGGPGCGKTTLLKYLSRQAQEKEGRLAVWLELKAIAKPAFVEAEKASARDGSLTLRELWLKHLKAQLSLTDAQIQVLRAHWDKKFRSNEIAVLLDGFDEVQDKAIQRSLNRCISEFACAAHNNTLLISTRPYAQHELGRERLEEFEIEPLSQQQIESFLNSYFPKDAATTGLLKNLRERSSLKELLNVPLLLGIVLRLQRENRFINDRLKLYDRIITDLLREVDRSKSVVRRFAISDERLRMDFLKFLAFEQLLLDPLEGEEREVNRITFSYALLNSKAKRFLAREASSCDPRDLANDALATPLLREVTEGIFAFTHLILQEVLAARAFSAFYQENEFAALRVFSRAFYDPRIVEMEVLPMSLGALANANRLYDEIERWPESITFANLRLRARGLGYSPLVDHDRAVKLCEKLIPVINCEGLDEYPYRVGIITSFANTHGTVEDWLISTLSGLLANPDPYARINVIEALAILGSERAVNLLLPCLQDADPIVQVAAAEFVGWTRNDHAIEGLVTALKSNDVPLRWNAATALGRIGSERAIEPLSLALKDSEQPVRDCAIKALEQIGTEAAAEALTRPLREEVGYLRRLSAQAIGKIGSVDSIGDLISSLEDDDSESQSIAYALKQIASDKAALALREVLGSEDPALRLRAVEALGLIASNEAIEILLTASHDENKSVRKAVITALATSITFFLLNTDSDGLSAIEPKNLNRALESFMLALEDRDCEVRVSAAKAFMSVRDERAIPYLETALRDSNEELRASATTALGVAGSKRSIGPLLSALADEVADVRAMAAFSLGQIRSAEAIEPVSKALRDKEALVRRHAAKALGIFGSKSAIEPLTEALHDEDYKVRGFAAEALGEIGGESASDSLREMLSDREVLVREYAIESLGKICGDRALEDLSLALHDESGHVRTRATEQIAVIGSEQSTKAVDLLGTALLDPDMNVNDRAAKALGTISSQQAIQILTDALENERHDTRWNSIQALAQKKTKPIVKAIFRVVCDPASDLRGYSAWYLSLCDEVELQAAIISCWNDPKPFVRKKVAQLAGYYCDDPHTSLLLAELAETDSDGDVRDAAKVASEHLARKLELLGRVVSEGTASTITDNESSELFLVGEAFKVVAEAGHIFRPTSNSDWGIDGEIEFKDEKGRASGKRVYLQLKSGDSHLHERKSDSKEIFTIKNPRHVEYWQSHAYPVLLVIRDSGGRIRWMNITDYLRRHGPGIRQIEFEGEPFNAGGINKMRTATDKD